MKLFKRFAKKTAKKEASTDPVICRVKVYNRAINAPVATVDFKLSEKYLVGSFKAQYPANAHRIETINY